MIFLVDSLYKVFPPQDVVRVYFPCVPTHACVPWQLSSQKVNVGPIVLRHYITLQVCRRRSENWLPNYCSPNQNWSEYMKGKKVYPDVYSPYIGCVRIYVRKGSAVRGSEWGDVAHISVFYQTELGTCGYCSFFCLVENAIYSFMFFYAIFTQRR